MESANKKGHCPKIRIQIQILIEKKDRITNMYHIMNAKLHLMFSRLDPWFSWCHQPDGKPVVHVSGYLHSKNLKYKIFQKICLVLSLTRHSWLYGCLCNGHNNEFAENYGSNSKLHFRSKFGALLTSSSATFHLGWTCNNLILVTQTTYDVSVIFFNEPEKDFFEFILSSFTLSL